MAPLVSIIVPTYNRCDLLEKALNSVLDQSYDNIEVLVVDDGSTDSTSQMVRSFADQRIIYICQQNSGASRARNKGVLRSSGDYLAFLDDDDSYLPQKISSQIELLIASRNCDLVAGGGEVLGIDGTLHSAKPWLGFPELNPDVFLYSCPIKLQAILMKKEWWIRIGGLDESLVQAHDHDFFLRLSLAGCRMCWQKLSVYRYIYHGNQLSMNAHRQTECRVLMMRKVLHQDNIPVHWIGREDEIIGYQYLRGAFHALAVGQNAQAHELMRCALGLYPRFATVGGRAATIGLIEEYSNWETHGLSPHQFVDRVKQEFGTLYSSIDRSLRITHARLYMAAFFDAYNRREYRRVVKMGLLGIRHDPSWLRNLGVISILAKSLMRSTTDSIVAGL